MILLLFCMFVASTWESSKAIIIIETSPITNGVEMSLKDWYGESPYSISVQQEVVVEASDSTCDFVTSGVIAALARKRMSGILSEEQESRALDRFQSCLGKLCNNSAMVDAFMRPETFREQIDLLVAVAKLSDVIRGKESGDILLNLLVDGELKEILSEVPYPPNFPDGSDVDITAALVPYVDVVMKVLKKACTSAILTVGAIDIPAITEVLLSSLNDRYTSNAISAEEVASVWNMKTLEEYEELWHGIAEKIASPTSALTGTCLDPAVAYFNYEKISLTRIRQIAISKGLCAEATEGEISGMVPPLENGFDESAMLYDSGSLPNFDYLDLGAAPEAPAPGGGTEEAPSQTGFSPISPPDNSIPSYDGPPM